MKFSEVSEEAKKEGKMFRRMGWPSGVVGEWMHGHIKYYHVTACELPTPPEEDFYKEDWIIVREYGKDIGYKWI